MGRISRRGFLKGMGGAAAAAVYGCSKNEGGETLYLGGLTAEGMPEAPAIEEKIFRGASGHNCGGRCLLAAYVKDGVIKRFATDERPDLNDAIDGSGIDDPQRRACVRCRGKAPWYYRKDRLLYPLKQTRQRGDLNGFVRISWKQAFEEIARSFGEAAALTGSDMAAEGRTWVSDLPNAGKMTFSGLCATADGSQLANAMGAVTSLLNLFGSQHPYPDNTYSYPCIDHVTRFTMDNHTWGYKVAVETNSRTDFKNADHIVAWCTNPADSVMGTNSMWYLLQAKELGTKFTCVDSQVSRTSLLLNAKHIAPLPGTDTALVMGMICYLLDLMLADKAAGKPRSEWIIDPDFIKTYVYGFFDTGNSCIVKPNKFQLTDALYLDMYQRAFPVNFPGGNIPGVGDVPTMGFGPATGYEVPRGASLSAYIFGNDRGLVDADLNLATSIYPAEIGYNVNAANWDGAGAPADELYGLKTPIYGQVKKTPEWAERITGVPAEDIKELAVKIAAEKTTILLTGGLQKSCEGEQAPWAIYALAMITGCWGEAGRSFGTINDRNRFSMVAVGGPSQPASVLNESAALKRTMTRYFRRDEKLTHPELTDNKSAALFPIMLWQDQMEYGGTGKSRWNAPEVKYGPTIKAVLLAGGNSLINQGGDAGRCAEIAKNRNYARCIVVNDFFMTPSARYADYVLPAAMAWERDSMATSWQCGETILNMPKAVEPPGEALSDMEICQGIAEAIGRRSDMAYDEPMEVIKRTAYETGKATLALPAFESQIISESYEEFVEQGMVSLSNVNSPDVMPLAYYRQSAVTGDAYGTKYGLCTSTGKFEAYSQSLMEDYEARRYNNFDTTVTLAEAADKNGVPVEGRIYSKACGYKNIEDTPTAVLEAASAAEKSANERAGRFVYPIPMYIPLIEGAHACDGDAVLGDYPAADATGATKHPDCLKKAATHPFCLNTYHSIKRSHSTMNNSPYVNETYKIGENGEAAFLDPERRANGGGENNLEIWDAGVYEPVHINPADADALGIKNGRKVKLTSIRGTAIYAAAKITNTVRPGHLIMAEGGWACPDADGADIGGAVNTLFSLRPSRICRGSSMANGLRIKLETVR